MEINKIYYEDCLQTMSKMPDCFIDLTVTSPPYDNLREYKGYSFEFEKISKELFRITKKEGFWFGLLVTVRLMEVKAAQVLNRLYTL